MVCLHSSQVKWKKNNFSLVSVVSENAPELLRNKINPEL